jgi:hypothetical protein
MITVSLLFFPLPSLTSLTTSYDQAPTFVGGPFFPGLWGEGRYHLRSETLIRLSDDVRVIPDRCDQPRVGQRCLWKKVAPPPPLLTGTPDVSVELTPNRNKELRSTARGAHHERERVREIKKDRWDANSAMGRESGHPSIDDRWWASSRQRRALGFGACRVSRRAQTWPGGLTRKEARTALQRAYEYVSPTPTKVMYTYTYSSTLRIVGCAFSSWNAGAKRNPQELQHERVRNGHVLDSAEEHLRQQPGYCTT